MNKQYIVMSIGCLECGDASDLLGIFKSLEEAEQVADKYSGGEYDYDWKVDKEHPDPYKTRSGATVIFLSPQTIQE